MFIHHRSRGVIEGEVASSSFGTWVFLGGLVTSLELTPTPSSMVQSDACGTCRRCIDACPTDAFTAPFELDLKRCLTTWNVEKPLEDPSASEHVTALEGHGWAVGCDVCQEVCPYNRWATVVDEPRFGPRPGFVALTPSTIPDDEDLVGTPLARPGREGLLRAVNRALAKRRTVPTPEVE